MGCKTFGDIEVESFGVSHDAAEPMFYAFHNNNRKLALITDTGYVSDRMKGVIKGLMLSYLKVIMTWKCFVWDVIHGVLNDVF